MGDVQTCTSGGSADNVGATQAGGQVRLLPAVQEDGGSLQSREFWIACGAILFTILSSTALLWFGKIENTQWVDLMKWAPPAFAAIFGLAKTMQKAVAAWSAK